MLWQTRWSFPFLMAALLLQSCTSTPTTEAPETSEVDEQPPAIGVTDTSWLARKIYGQDAKAARSTLTFDDETQVSGSTGCNNFRGEVELKGSTVKFGILAATRRMCSPAISGQETVFLEALEEARYWARIGSTLKLLDENNNSVVEFSDKAAEHRN